MLKRTMLAAALAATVSAPAAGQSPGGGRIHGTVRDPHGRAIAGARVIILCAGERRDVTTSNVGAFEATGLPDGDCEVTASSTSFEPESALVNPRSGKAAGLVLSVRQFASEVVVTPTRGSEESTFSVPETVSVVSRSDIDARPYTLFSQVLREEPGILLQQTTSAQVSPIIRGFTGQSNVYVLDGVRLNTAAWRSGPSQYFTWVNGGPIESIEVVRGGGAVQYGSDALGGTIQLRTGSALAGIQAPLSGGVELTAGSADRLLGAQADVALRYGNASMHVGGGQRRAEDLRAGDGLDSHSAATRFLGLSSSVFGTRQRDTAFEQGGLYARADVGFAERGALHALVMHESQEGANRYDRLLGGEGLYRSGFEPQALNFGFVRYDVVPGRVLDGISATVSVNRQADGRFEQARPVARLDRQESTTTALGYQLQGTHSFGAGNQLMVGTEVYDESIDASRELVETNGTRQFARPDIADGTSYTSLGVFAQQRVDVVPDRLSIRGGVRFSRFVFDATADPALGVVDEHEVMQSTTFQVAAVLRLAAGLNLTGSVNRGFRAANAADFGSTGLTGGGGFEISPSRARDLGALVGTTGATGAVSTGEPASSLKPEVVYQYELGLKARLGPLSGSVSGFDMELYDFIQRRALVFTPSIVGTVISGFEVVRVDGTGLAYIAQDVRPIATRVNTDRGRISGMDAEGEVRVGPWTAAAHFSLANGRTLPGGEFLRRMPPPMGGVRLRWTRNQFWGEGVALFAREQTRFNSGDLTDARIGAVRTRASIATFFNGTATDLGLVRDGVLLATGERLAQVQDRVLGSANSLPLFTSHPGFVTLGLRGGLRLSRHLEIALIGENLADTNYRLYGSGIDAPGRNVQVRTQVRF